MVKNLPAIQETWVWSLGWEDSLEKGTATHFSILAWRIRWTEEPEVPYSPWGRKESDTTEQVTHTCIHSWGNQASEKVHNLQKATRLDIFWILCLQVSEIRLQLIWVKKDKVCLNSKFKFQIPKFKQADQRNESHKGSVASRILRISNSKFKSFSGSLCSLSSSRHVSLIPSYCRKVFSLWEGTGLPMAPKS